MMLVAVDAMGGLRHRAKWVVLGARHVWCWSWEVGIGRALVGLSVGRGCSAEFVLSDLGSVGIRPALVSSGTSGVAAAEVPVSIVLEALGKKRCCEG